MVRPLANHVFQKGPRSSKRRWEGGRDRWCCKEKEKTASNRRTLLNSFSTERSLGEKGLPCSGEEERKKKSGRKKVHRQEATQMVDGRF